MPQRVTRLPVVTSLQRRARTVLEAMAKEIRQREQELATLKVEAARWQSVLRESARGPGPTPSPGPKRSAKRSPLDWSAILPELPAGFPTTDIA